MVTKNSSESHIYRKPEEIKILALGLLKKE